jgi:Protein of unknown function (DUF1236)
MRNKLLIATAVTALLAGTGLASAQEKHEGAPGGGRPAPQASHAQPAAPHAQATPQRQPMQQQHMQSQRQNAAPTHMGQNEPNRANKSDRLNAQERRNQPSKMEERRGTAQNQQKSEERRNTVQNQGKTEERRNTVERQGKPEERQNTAQGRENGRNVQLSTEQRTKIRQTIIAQSGAPRVSRTELGGINLRVGVAIPRDRIHFRPLPLPESVVEIYPEWQGFLYFLVGDEVVVVDPATYDVVAILPA